MLTIALPKGRLMDKVLELLAEAQIIDSKELCEQSRKLIIEDPKANFRYILAKPIDVPTYVEHGVADLGVVGKDILIESERLVYELMDLGIGKCRMIVAVSDQSNLNEVKELGFSAKVATKYPNITTSFFRSHGIQSEIIELNGSIELAPLVGLADAIVDITETGTTIRENGLRIIGEVFPISARLIANHVSYKLHYKKLQDIQEKLEGVVQC
ncbi:MAG: ATP phosphoribosyltransferase [Bacillota bacterium]|jgi:ATP phosphoribosyltransferase|nr:ATP phosphoribosyltransferase [Bacillota bacterium]NLU55646.1 ATP phosphoribosyltransferase [Bacillota bacterium]HOA90289.1 ATP phosphoribosyltransferase [Bacillota bacterium]HOP53120.1 ATP phosphoribosyltransferase [Bacillota bacterium]HPT60026.1 ATP phosphoribosyltransferase [Bacillota bacterium]